VIGGAGVLSVAANAQQTPTPVVGFLHGGAQEGYAPMMAAFRKSLLELSALGVESACTPLVLAVFRQVGLISAGLLRPKLGRSCRAVLAGASASVKSDAKCPRCLALHFWI